jgi:hypothetical protein
VITVSIVKFVPKGWPESKARAINVFNTAEEAVACIENDCTDEGLYSIETFQAPPGYTQEQALETVRGLFAEKH